MVRLSVPTFLLNFAIFLLLLIFPFPAASYRAFSSKLWAAGDYGRYGSAPMIFLESLLSFLCNSASMNLSSLE